MVVEFLQLLIGILRRVNKLVDCHTRKNDVHDMDAIRPQVRYRIRGPGLSLAALRLASSLAKIVGSGRTGPSDRVVTYLGLGHTDNVTGYLTKLRGRRHAAQLAARPECHMAVADTQPDGYPIESCTEYRRQDEPTD